MTVPWDRSGAGRQRPIRRLAARQACGVACRDAPPVHPESVTPWLRRARERLADGLAAQRVAASRGDALPQLAVLAVAVGVLTALVMIGFRTIIEAAQRALLPAGPLLENFAALSPGMRFALPVAGALAVGLLFTAVPAAARQVGIVHVMAGPWAGLSQRSGDPLAQKGVGRLGRR
jgi:hypothetical protein